MYEESMQSVDLRKGRTSVTNSQPQNMGSGGQLVDRFVPQGG